MFEYFPFLTLPPSSIKKQNKKKLGPYGALFIRETFSYFFLFLNLFCLFLIRPLALCMKNLQLFSCHCFMAFQNQHRSAMFERHSLLSLFLPLSCVLFIVICHRRSWIHSYLALKDICIFTFFEYMNLLKRSLEETYSKYVLYL